MRRSGRVLLLDESGRVLLMGAPDAGFGGRVVWVPPGGGAENGEDLRSAAARELREETGLRREPADLGEPVATRSNSAFDEAFFLVSVTSSFSPEPTGANAAAVPAGNSFRWWSADDLRTTRELVFPEGLAELLDAIASRHEGAAEV